MELQDLPNWFEIRLEGVAIQAKPDGPTRFATLLEAESALKDPEVPDGVNIVQIDRHTGQPMRRYPKKGAKPKVDDLPCTVRRRMNSEQGVA